MRITMIGTGYVGLVSGACFSEFGHDVICVDKDESKIDRLLNGEIPIFEPGLDSLVEKNVRNGNLKFSTDLHESVKDVDAVFIAVGTPSRRGDGHADLSFVYAAAKEVAESITGYTVIVTKSTVPVGTGREVENIIRETRPDADFNVASNPEFLREGSAIEDFMRPDRVVCGSDEQRALEVLKEIYRPLYLRDTPMVLTQLETAELIKYAANTFLAVKITFINEMANVCEKVGADVQELAKGMGLDGRIGSKFLHPGPGYGGSCFPKDTRAMVAQAEAAGAPTQIVESVVRLNEERKLEMADKVLAACGGSVSGKNIGILGLTFKPNTDDMRESASLDILPALSAKGAKLFAYDPEGMDEAKKLLADTPVEWQDGVYQCVDDMDAVVIITEWNEFRALDPRRLKENMRQPLMIDLRNIYNPGEMAAAGIDYHCIGRPYVAPVA